MNVNDNAAGQFALQRAALGTTDPSLKWNALWDYAQSSPGIALAYRRPPSINSSSVENLGIGAPTRVDLVNGKLTVSAYVTPTTHNDPPAQSRWHMVWSTDPDWRVTGYSVGDGNGDGKPDLIYTLWKHQQVWERPPDGGMHVDPNGGDFLPHIFINTWTRGGINPLWQGSPRPQPILSAVAAPIAKRRQAYPCCPRKQQPQRRASPRAHHPVGLDRRLRLRASCHPPRHLFRPLGQGKEIMYR